MWKLVKVYPGAEERIAKKIKDFLGLNDDDILIPSKIFPHDAKSLSEIIFIKISEQQNNILKNAILMEKIRCFLDPKIIPDIQIEKMLINKEKMVNKPIFSAGEYILVIEGIYNGLEGRILEVSDNVVKVSLKVFQMEQIDSVSFESIKKLDGNSR